MLTPRVINSLTVANVARFGGIHRFSFTDVVRTLAVARSDASERAVIPSGPIPKFVSTRGTFRYELWNLRTTSNCMILVDGI